MTILKISDSVLSGLAPDSISVISPRSSRTDLGKSQQFCDLKSSWIGSGNSPIISVFQASLIPMKRYSYIS